MDNIINVINLTISKHYINHIGVMYNCIIVYRILAKNLQENNFLNNLFQSRIQ